MHRLPYIHILIINHVIALVSVVETVDIYLVYNSALRPIRCLKARIDNKIIGWIELPVWSCLIIVNACTSHKRMEIILRALCSERKFSNIIIKIRVSHELLHAVCYAINHNLNSIHIVLCSSELKLHSITG